MTPASNEPMPAFMKLQLRAAQRLGLSLRVLDEELGYLHELSDGTRSRVLPGARSPLNLAAPQRLCELKYYTQRVLEEHGFRVPATVRCIRRDGYAALGAEPADAERRARRSLDDAREFAAARAPVIVKPNGLGRGFGVREVTRAEDIEANVRDIFEHDDTALVQAQVRGADLRVDMIDGQLMVAYERVAIRVEGDGVSTLHELLCALDDRFAQPDFVARASKSPSWRAKVLDAGYGLDSVLARESIVDLGPVLNLNETARCVVHETVPRAWLDHVARIGQALRMRHYGVDLRVPGGFEASPADATLIEVNGSPLLIQLAELGYEELAITAQMRVLEAVFREPQSQR